ncbi:MAG: hypothetical protein BWY15_00001 [Firmicutes bacterium ADurb.Bin193]|nr:MAG: hypothetical protein BWY15_00001 [Firmicutes bacterium ADurb.Bin193]
MLKTKRVLKCISASLALAVFLTAYVFNVPITANAQGEKIEWRPIVGRYENDMGADKANLPELYAKGRYGGEGFQWMHGGAAHPDGTVLLGQDMGFARVSTDFGKTWYTPQNEGLYQQQGYACAIDPADSNVMFIAMTCAGQHQLSPGFKDIDGIYRTDNKGKSWTMVAKVGQFAMDRYYRDTFASFPLSGGTVEGRIWRFATTSTNDIGDRGLFTSDPGGLKWEKICEFPLATYGDRIYTLKQHPTDINTLFMSTSTGLFKTTDGGKTWNKVRPDMFSGKVNTVWIDPDNALHLLLSFTHNDAAKHGIYESNDGGETWTNIMNEINPAQMGVGAKNADGKRIIYVHNVNPAKAKIRNFSGQWVDHEVQPDNPGTWTQNNITGRQQAFFLPHPTIPDLSLAVGNAYFWRSEGTEGRVWKSSSTGFIAPRFYDMAFDETDWKKFGVALQDTGNYFTENGGDWFERNDPDHLVPQMKQVHPTWPGGVTVHSMICLPDPWPANVPPPVDPNAPGRYIIGIGPSQSTVQQFLMTRDKGKSEWKEWIEESVDVGGGFTNRSKIFYHMQNPNIVYAGPNISMDGGNTWTINPKRKPVIGMSRINSDIVYSYSQPSRTEFALLKSTDRGQTWKEIYRTVITIDDNSGGVPFFFNPTNDRYIYTVDENRDLMIIKEGDDGVWTGTSLSLKPYSTIFPPAWGVKKVVADYHDPYLVYVLLGHGGAPMIYRGRLNKDFTACAWEDITMNAPRIYMSGLLFLSPVTGDLIFGSGNGNFVFPAPDDWQHSDPNMREYKRALWKNMPLPIPNGWDGYAKDDKLNITIDGKPQTFDPPAMIQNDRTMVPMRAIFEIMGATVDWDETTSTVTATKGNTTITLTIGSTEAKLNGQPLTLDVAPFTHNDRTMVPLRFISESLGAAVQWSGTTNTVILASNKPDDKILAATPVPRPEYKEGDIIIEEYVTTEEKPLSEVYPIVSAKADQQGQKNLVVTSMFDGDLTTNWTTGSAPCRIDFDLGSEKTVDCVAIAWGGGDQRIMIFSLEASTDGKTFTPIAGFQSSGYNLQPERYEFPAKTLRYLRVIGYRNTINTWTNIFEIQIGRK